MKIIKRFLCIFLMFSLMAGSVVWADIDLQDDYTEIYEALERFGVYKPLDSMGIDAYSYLTRGEMAMLLCYMLDFKEVPEGQDYFDDVKSDHPYYANISLLTVKKIISPYNRFRPDDTISFGEATKLIMVALNYRAVAEHRGGYPMGYIYLAQEKGLYKNLEGYRSSGVVTFGAASVMILNALEMPILVSLGYGEFTSNKFEESDSLLYDIYKIKKIKGLVNATDFSAIGVRNKPLNEGLVEIDSVAYDTGGTDISRYLGYRVMAYIKENEENTNEQILLYKTETRHDSVAEISTDNISSADVSNHITYTVYTDTNIKKIYTIKSTSPIIYNNCILTDVDRGERHLADFLIPENGKIRLLDYDNDGEYDIVFIYEYHTITVGRKTTTKVFDKNSTSFLDLDTSLDRNIIIYKDEEIITLQELRENYVLSVAESINTVGTKIIVVYVSDRVERGTVTEITQTEGSHTVVINGNSYKLDPNVDANTDIQLGVQYTFYISSIGRIASVDKSVISLKRYAWYIAGEANDNKLSTPVQVKILDSDGQVKVLNLSTKISFMDKDASVFSRINATDFIKAIQPKQLIIININNSGEVDSITLASDKKSDSRFNILPNPASPDTNRFRPKGGGDQSLINNQLYSYNMYGKVFEVPDTDNLDDSHYRVTLMSVKDLSSEQPGDNDVLLYDVDKYNVINAVVKFKQQTLGSAVEDAEDLPIVMVSGFSTVVNSNGDISKKLYVQNSRAQTSKVFSPTYYVFDGYQAKGEILQPNQDNSMHTGDLVIFADEDQYGYQKSLSLQLSMKKFIEEKNVMSNYDEAVMVDGEREYPLTNSMVWKSVSGNPGARAGTAFGRIKKHELRRDAHHVANGMLYIEIMCNNGRYVISQAPMTNVTQYQISTGKASNVALSEAVTEGTAIFVRWYKWRLREIFVIID